MSWRTLTVPFWFFHIVFRSIHDQTVQGNLKKCFYIVRRVETTLFPSCHCTCLLNYEVPVVSIYTPLSELFCWGWKLLLLNCFPRAPTFTLQPLYNRIKSSLGTETKPCLLLIDDLTALLSVGVPLQQITNFIHYCAALMCHSPTVVCNVSKYHL